MGRRKPSRSTPRPKKVTVPIFAASCEKQRRQVHAKAQRREVASGWNERGAFLFSNERNIRRRSLIMAGGWARDGAVQEQIDDTLADAVKHARARLPAGEGLEDCEICGDEIPEARRRALPGTRTCVPCQSDRDAKAAVAPSGFNRRGSKDSQLR
jgi:phage/conjugal plasmid C-4 type zinc finger TraR family protein